MRDDEKTMSADSLDKSSFEDSKSILKPTSLTEKILGFPCKAYTVMPDPELEFPGNISTLVWYSDSLRFIIPLKYRNKRSIETLPDGNMLFFKMEAFMSFNDDDNKDDIIKSKIDSFFLMVEKIERVTLKDSEFLPPAGYT